MSRVRGNFHARFLGGKAPVRVLTYPTGTFKSLFGTPIINQPQVAILGVGYIEKKPAVIETPEGDVIAIRHKMYLSLSYDHRVVDGSLGGNFLYFIKDYLENWKE